MPPPPHYPPRPLPTATAPPTSPLHLPITETPLDSLLPPPPTHDYLHPLAHTHTPLYTPTFSAGFTLRKNYCKYVFAYECRYDRGGVDPVPILAQLDSSSSKKDAAKRPASSAGKIRPFHSFPLLSLSHHIYI